MRNKKMLQVQLLQMAKSDPSLIKPVTDVLQLMSQHRTREARIQLLAMLRDNRKLASKKGIKALLSMCQHHSVKVFVLSLPVVLFWFTLASGGLVGLKLWVGSTWGEDAVRAVGLLNIIVPTTAYLGLRWARDKYPTCCAPEMPWPVLLLTVLVLTTVLLMDYWLVLIVCTAIASGLVVSIDSLILLFEQVLFPSTLLTETFRFALSHPLQTLATLVTVGFGYYGPVDPAVVQAVGLYNEVVD